MTGAGEDPAALRPERALRFEFATAGRILFGVGAVDEAVPLVAGFGRRALLVTGRSAQRATAFAAALRQQAVDACHLPVSGEPTTDVVREGAALARRERCALVVGFGGGSALDAAKAIAGLLTNPGDLFDYLEVIGRGQPLTQPAAPWVAIPTTAGTGAEVTRNAVLASPPQRVKVSLRSPQLLPRLAVVDPQLTYALPPALTATTGLDALTQLIEPYVSVRANPCTDAFCREGLRRVARSLLRAYQDGRDAPAREDMALASLYGGLALANAGLGAVHGFAGPIGGMFPAPHGAVCAALLPPTMAANVRALRARQPRSPLLARFEQLAALLTGRPDVRAEAGVEWVRDLCAQLAIPGLRAYGLTGAELPDVADKAARASSMKANPVTLTSVEMLGILQSSL